MPRFVLAVSAAALLLAPRALPAQDFGLVTGLFRDVNDITIFFQLGGIHGSDDVATRRNYCCLTGGGTEVLLNLRSSEQGVSYELGLGASYLRGFHARDETLDLRGSVRALPTISLYGSHPRVLGQSRVGGYLGLNFGLLELWHAQAYTPQGEQWGVRAQTFELGGAGGLYLREGPFSGLFAEATYRLRRFPTVEWSGPGGAPVPEGWPRALDFSGPLFSLGWQFAVREDRPPPPAWAGTWLAERLDAQPLPALLGQREGPGAALERRELTGAILNLSPAEDGGGGQYELTMLVRQTVRAADGTGETASRPEVPQRGRYLLREGGIQLHPEAGGAPHTAVRSEGHLHLRLAGTGHLVVFRRAAP